MNARNGESAEREQILHTLQQLVDPIAASIIGPAEVVLHDLSRLPNSIVAIGGDLTGRRVGDPATDTLLQAAASGRFENGVGYRTTTPDGRDCLSTTTIVADSAGEPVAALCLNRDISGWSAVQDVAASLAKMLDDEAEGSAPKGEFFARDVDELASLLLDEAIAESPLALADMKKEHKVAVVRRLKERGFFLLRDAAETAANALACTRFTIYNYLNEIEGE